MKKFACSIALFLAASAWAFADPPADQIKLLDPGARVKVTLKSQKTLTGQIISFSNGTLVLDSSSELGFSSRMSVKLKDMTAVQSLQQLTDEEKTQASRKIAEERKGDIDRFIKDGRKEYDSGNFASARDILEAAVGFYPENREAAELLAAACFKIAQSKFDDYDRNRREPDLEAWIGASRRAASLVSDDAEYQLLFGASLLAATDYYGSLKPLHKSAELATKDARPRYLLSLSLYMLDELAEAEAQSAAGLAIEPDNDDLKKIRETILKEKEEAEQFFEIASANFKVRYKGSASDDPIGKEVLQMLADEFTQLQEIFKQEFNAPIKVILYPDDEYYTSTGAMGFYAAHYEPGKKKMHIPLRAFKDKAAFTSDLRHELTHAFLHNFYPEIPRWMDEGIAQMQSGKYGADFKESLDQSLTQMAEDGTLQAAPSIPESAWLEFSHEKDKMQLYYQESLSFAMFLAESYPDIPMSEFAIQSSRMGPDDAAEKVFGIALDKLCRIWLERFSK